MKRILLLFILSLVSLPALRADDFSLMRERLRSQIIYSDSDDPSASALYDNEAEFSRRDFQRDATCLWPDLPHLAGNKSFTPAHICESYRRLMLMARAYSFPACRAYHSPELLSDIRYGLSYLYTHAYSERTRMLGNWWEWRIGIPWYYAYTVCLLYDELSPDELSAFERATSSFTYGFARNGDLTFANQASLCRNLLFIGIVSGNDNYVRTALNAAIPAFADASTPAERMQAVNRQNNIIRRQRSSARVSTLVHKEGLYADGTFIQHSSMPYIGTYGTEIIAMASYLAILLPETQYSVPEEIIASLSTWISGAYLPAIWQDQMMLMFCGRSVDANTRSNAYEVLSAIARAVPLIPDSAERAAIEARLSGAALPFSRVYAAGDRAIHQTPTWRFGLSMSSNRIAKYECFIRPTARQNTRGWYQGDGMTYLYLPSDPEQYLYYFSAVDPYRLPGTTVIPDLERTEVQAVQPLYAMPAEAASEARAGGVSLNGCSAAMMRLVSSASDLRAKKSWFMFPREVVCLGADILCSSDHQVITVVENRRNHSDVYVQPKNGNYHKLPSTNEPIACGPVRLAYLDGVGAYWFPDAPGLLAETNNEGATCLWLSHNAAPQQASYAYVLLPEMSSSDAQLYTRQPDVRILRNTPGMQAVYHFGLNLTSVNFWAAGSLVADAEDIASPSLFPSVRSDGVAALMMQQLGDSLSISVADPTWDRPSMQFILDGRYALQSSSAPSLVSISYRADRYTVIDINSRYSLGQAVEITLTGE